MATAYADLTPARRRRSASLWTDEGEELIVSRGAAGLTLVPRPSASVEAPRPTSGIGGIPMRRVIVGLVLVGWWMQRALVAVPLEGTPTAAQVAASDLPSVASIGGVRSMPAQQTSAIHPARLAAIKPAPAARAGDTARRALAANPGGRILHSPSVSVGTIRRLLRVHGSPALAARYADGKDAAEYIWDEGRALGVDPAVVMAIFNHESHYGTLGMAPLTLSVGNIRPLPGEPQLNGYRRYSSWEEGIDACYTLLLQYARNGAPTVATAIPVWAPPADDNNDAAYIGSVLSTMQAMYSAG